MNGMTRHPDSDSRAREVHPSVVFNMHTWMVLISDWAGKISRRATASGGMSVFIDSMKVDTPSAETDSPTAYR